MGIFDPDAAPASAPAAPIAPGPAAEPPTVLSLQETCWRIVQRGVTCSNVIELMSYMDHFNLPESCTVSAHCMRYVERAYATLRQRRGVEELQQQLPAAMFAALEEAIAASEESAKGRGIRGRILEPEALGDDSREEVPSVSGAPHSYRLSALVTGMAWPADVDPQHRERSLGPAHFLTALGSTYAEFLAKPAWKQRVLKQDAALF